MLENVVAWVLNNYIGEYLEDLNTDQLSVALLSGQVELENVPLKKTALRKLDLPLEVKSGVLGKLTLSIPITRVRSEPWTLKLSDVLILVGPPAPEKRYDVEAVERTEQAKKQQQLDELEQRHRSELAEAMGVSAGPAKDDSWWGASLISTVVNNMQLILSNVHICYEDGSSAPVPFNCGVRIQHMSAQTTNAQWKPGFVEPQEGVNTFKKLELRGFSLYWNSAATLVEETIKSYKDLQTLLSPEKHSSTSHVMEPCSAELRMERHASKLPLKGDVPRFKFFLRPEKIAIELSRRQMSELRALNREWARFERARIHRKWRPTGGIKGNARDWWQFALGRICDDRKSQQSQATTWTDAHRRAQHVNAYTRAYQRRLRALASNVGKSDAVADPSGKKDAGESEDRMIMKQIERDQHYGYNELHILRERVFRRLVREAEAARGLDVDSTQEDQFEQLDLPEDLGKAVDGGAGAAGTATAAGGGGGGVGLYGWVTSFFQAEQNADETEDGAAFEVGKIDMSELKAMAGFKEMEEELLEALHETWDDSTVLRRDRLLAEIQLRIEHVTCRFIDAELVSGVEERRVLALDLVRLASRVELSPRTHSVQLSLTVHDMSVQRLSSQHRLKPSTTAQTPDDYDDEGLMYSLAENTKVLLAVGRSTLETDRHDDKPLFKMMYRRRSPRFTVRHSIDGSFRPISILYEEGAIEGVAELFQDDPHMFLSPADLLAEADAGRTGSSWQQRDREAGIESHVFVNMHIPKVSMELRKIGWWEQHPPDGGGKHPPGKAAAEHIGLPTPSSAPSLSLLHSAGSDGGNGNGASPFACLVVTDVALGLASKEKHLTKIRMGVGHVELTDLLEHTTYPLLTTRRGDGMMKSFSTSCPDLVQTSWSSSSAGPFSSSLPTTGFFDAAMSSLRSQSSTCAPGMGGVGGGGSVSRKTSCVDGPAGGGGGGRKDKKGDDVPHECAVQIVLVGKHHPQFESVYGKRNCSIEMELDDVELGMNRRTWTALIDFAGLLGKFESEEDEREARSERSLRGEREREEETQRSSKELDIDKTQRSVRETTGSQREKKGAGGLSSKESAVDNSDSSSDSSREDDVVPDGVDSWMVGCSVRLRRLRTHMNYPANGTRLGAMQMDGVELVTSLRVGEVNNELAATVSLEGMRLTDRTPDYSRMYDQRLVIGDEHDRSLEPRPPSRAVIKIVKYLGENNGRECDLRMEMKVPKEMKLYYTHTHRYFCALMDFWMQFFELQDQVAKSKKRVVVEGARSKVRLDLDLACACHILLPMNQFSDRLLLWQTDGVRVSNCFRPMSALMDVFERASVEREYGYDNAVDCALDCVNCVLADLQIYEAQRVEGARRVEEEFRQFAAPGVEWWVRAERNSVFSKRVDLTVDVYRNMDGAVSHNAPDMTILTGVHGLSWRLTTEFYMLFRGFLEKNLGEQLIPVPETIPFEILQKPIVSCEVGSANKYATLSLRINFEDVQLECLVPDSGGGWQPLARMGLTSSRVSFDVFVDGQSELDLICHSTQLDDTRRGQPGSGQPNRHPVILRPRVDQGGKKLPSLMSEAHIMMRRDEPPVVTLVLMNARVVLLPDWLDDAKNFVLLSTDWNPPVSDFCVQQQQPGVVARAPATPTQPQQTFSVKLTLRDSDIYLLEDPSRVDSFAAVAFTSAVLNMNDQGGVLQANLEIQSTSVSWCLMHEADSTRNQCSNEFSIGIALSVERPDGAGLSGVAGALARGAGGGLPILAAVKHKLTVELVGLIGKLSYKDAKVLSGVLSGWTANAQANMGRSMVPVMANRPPGKPLELARLSLKTEHADVWLLDDLHGSAIPLLRVGLSNTSIDRQPERLSCAFTVNADYFNQHVFGWEPLLERWSVLRLLMTSKDNNHAVELITETKSTFDVNLTQQLIRQATQWAARWPAVRAQCHSHDFRTTCTRSRSEHLPYVLRNETGSALTFTTAVEDILTARSEHRKHSAKWTSVAASSTQNFEFPARLLLYSHSEREPPRQLIVRVDGWDEMSPVNVDACGTYFRVVKGRSQSGVGSSPRTTARLVIQVSMEKDGNKVVSIRSSIRVHNQLPHRIIVTDEETNKELMRVEAESSESLPLQHAHRMFTVYPVTDMDIGEKARVDWRSVRTPGEVLKQTVRLRNTKQRDRDYWMCMCIRREAYPEHESLPGHSVRISAPLKVLNTLPVDVELRMGGRTYALAAGKQMMCTAVDITREVAVSLTTDRLHSIKPCAINKSSIGEGQQLCVRMADSGGRQLDVYGGVAVEGGGSIALQLWVPFWIVNKSGLPLVIRQEASECDAAGQMEEHERAKDRHPLMFSFADDGCPKNCVVRVGCQYVNDPTGYQPKFSQRFALSQGVQALKLQLRHDSMPTKYYNIGVEVRAGQGRYKDTQVVLLTSRYVLNNLSSYTLIVCHHDLIDRASEHFSLSAQSQLVWNENLEERRLLAVRRWDVKHWSCPFRIDRVGSFHVTMRDADETPRFVRVEVILSSAVFYVTFTDAHLFPAPLLIENLSDVPVLYQQLAENVTKQHLRTICKAGSTVDYSWDDPYAEHRIVLQVYENKSHVYDPAVPGSGKPLQYENHSYIQLVASFNCASRSGRTDETELVLEALSQGKVVLIKQNKIDANGGNQLWRMCEDGCIENIGMEKRMRSKERRYVLDVLEKTGNQLMLCERNTSRDKWQKWHVTPDGRLMCGVKGVAVTARKMEVCLAAADAASVKNEDGVVEEQLWRLQRQRPGSGVLDVECLHSGPTLVVRIRDREQKLRSLSVPATHAGSREELPGNVEVSITMRGGIGLSIVDGQHEELVYARMSGILLHAKRVGNSYQMTAAVEVIQADNQLLGAERWALLFCQREKIEGAIELPESELPAGVGGAPPALRLEMNYTPHKHYDAFDCFRVKVCEVAVQLDELLLWKCVQFMQASDAEGAVQSRVLTAPPCTELDRPDPLRSRRCYFGTLDLEMGQVALSVVTVAKCGLPRELRQLRQQWNVKLVSFEGAAVHLPAFRQFHYFETSSFLLDSLRRFYFAELQKQTLNIIVTLDAFGNPLGLVTDLKDSFQGLFIEGDVQRFVAGLGYGVSNSISKMASSMAHGVGALTFDQEHELKRRHNMIRSHSTSSTPLTHLYSGVKGLGVGVLGGVTAIFTNTLSESRKNGIISGATRGIFTGAVDTVTKPVQGLFDLVEGTASAMKELAGPAASGGKTRQMAESRVRPPRLCRNLYHLLPPYHIQLARAQAEMYRINGYSGKERLLDVEVCLEQITADAVVRQYVLISSQQTYVCRQVNDEPSTVIQRVSYKYMKSAVARPELPNTLASVEVTMDNEHKNKQSHIWCSRAEVAKRLAEKMQRAKHEYDHSKRTLHEEGEGEE